MATPLHRDPGQGNAASAANQPVRERDDGGRQRQQIDGDAHRDDNCRNRFCCGMDGAERAAVYVREGGMGGAFVWPALLRKAERLDPGYKL